MRFAIQVCSCFDFFFFSICYVVWFPSNSSKRKDLSIYFIITYLFSGSGSGYILVIGFDCVEMLKSLQFWIALV